MFGEGGKRLSIMKFNPVKPYEDVYQIFDLEGQEGKEGWSSFTRDGVIYRPWLGEKRVYFQMQLDFSSNSKFIYEGFNDKIINGEMIKAKEVMVITGIPLDPSIIRGEEDTWGYDNKLFLRKDLLIGGKCPWTGSLMSSKTMRKLYEEGITQEEMDAICKHIYQYDYVNLNSPIKVKIEEGVVINASTHINRVDERLEGVLSLKRAQRLGSS